MSQRLPSRPNLNHLKKQAKDVLRVSRLRNRVWRLADAQNALARGYGFRSWPDLKLHVESARRRRSSRASAAGREPESTTANRIDAEPTATRPEHRGDCSVAVGVADAICGEVMRSLWHSGPTHRLGWRHKWTESPGVHS